MRCRRHAVLRAAASVLIQYIGVRFLMNIAIWSKTPILFRILLLMAHALCLPACTPAFQKGEVKVPVSYSANQIIDTTPGPFFSKIYVSGDKERQDASMGGGVVTTIIRRDKGVAWLLIPSQKQYQEVTLDEADFASIQPRFSALKKRLVGKESLDGQHTLKNIYSDASGREVAVAWVTDNGVVLKSEIFEDILNGKPKATVSLEHLQFGKQEQSLFEIPTDYSKHNAE